MTNRAKPERAVSCLACRAPKAVPLVSGRVVCGACSASHDLHLIEIDPPIVYQIQLSPRCKRCHHVEHDLGICNARSGGTAYQCGCLGGLL